MGTRFGEIGTHRNYFKQKVNKNHWMNSLETKKIDGNVL